MHRENNTNSAEKIKSETLGAVPVQLVDQVLPRLISVVDINGEILTSLPCLLKNNSIEASINSFSSSTELYIDALCSLLTSYHKKQAENLHLNVKRLIEKEAKSISHVGFLTLTFKENIKDNKEAGRRFNSFKTNFLSKYSEFGHWVNTKEQQTRGAWHFHLLVCLGQDIKKGVNFEELKNRKYSSASPYLRKIWKDLREAMPKYGFGWSELQPIRSNSDAMARYVGKYISKHIGQRDEENKGVRLISYSKGWTKNSVRFSWNNENAKEWRKKLKLFARMNGCQEFYQIAEKLGPGWPYKYMQDILNIYEIASDIITREEKVFESPTVQRIERQKEKRDQGQIQNLTIHHRRTDRQKEIEKNRLKISEIISPENIEKWITPERIEEFTKELEKNKEERIYRKASNEKNALDRMLLTRAAAEEFGIEIQNNNDIEGVPF